MSVQFSCSIVSDFATPWTAAHQAPLFITSFLSLLKYSCPLSQWYRPAISSSVAPFSSCLQSFPASGSFPMSQFFASDGQSIWAPASAPVLPRNIQGWFSSGMSGLISMLSKGLSRVFSNITVRMCQFLGTQPYLLANSHIYMITGKTIALTIWTFVSKVMFLLFKTLSSFDIAIREMQLKPGWWGCRQNWITHT